MNQIFLISQVVAVFTGKMNFEVYNNNYQYNPQQCAKLHISEIKIKIN